MRSLWAQNPAYMKNNHRIISQSSPHHCFLSHSRSKLRLCSANRMPGYSSNLPGYSSNLACDWLSVVWAYSEQETENRPRSHKYSAWQSSMYFYRIWQKRLWTHSCLPVIFGVMGSSHETSCTSSRAAAHVKAYPILKANITRYLPSGRPIT